MQAKIGIVEILRNFRVKLSNDTPRSMDYTKETFIMFPKNKIQIYVESL